MDRETYLDGLDVLTERAVDFLDVWELPPSEPFTETMNRLTDFDGKTVFVQSNDRELEFLYPKLDDRGSAYCSAERDEGVVIVIWEPRVGAVSDTPPACPSSVPGVAPSPARNVSVMRNLA